MSVRSTWRRRARLFSLAILSTAILWTALAPDASAGYRGRLLRMVNATRDNHDLHTLRIDTSLSGKAMHHTRRMIDADAIYDPTNLSQIMSGEPWTSVAASVVGCARGLRGLHRAFMHHAEHREILLDPKLRRIGIGLVKVYTRNSCGRRSFWGTELFYG